MDYSKYYGDIEKHQFKHFLPSNNTEINFNKENQRIEFLIDVGDNFVGSNFQYFISGEFDAKDGEKYGENSGTKLTDNFVPFLFRSIELKKHNKLIDRIENPGIISTIKNTITLSKDEAITKENSGIISTIKYGKFFVTGNLSDLGIDFFGDIKIPIYKGGFQITFIRSWDHDSCLRERVGDNLAPEGKITINDFFIRVPILEFQTPSKLSLINEMVTIGSQKFNFKTWECIEKTNISGLTHFSFDITNIYRNIDKPKFIIVSFQTDRNHQTKDTSKFDHVNVRNIRVKINESYYPEEMLNLEISEGNFALLYEMYKDYKKAFCSNTNMLYTPDEFIKNRPIFVLDVRKGPLNTSQSKNNILINVDFHNTTPTNTNIYIIVVSEKNLQYDFVNNNIIEM